jgi:L-tyrosine isonitrile desaturase/decarboxylase
MTTLTTTWTIQPLSPFGLLATTNPGADIYAVPTPILQTWAVEERVVVLRGFEPLAGEALPEFCETLGAILDEDADEEDELPLQWAGAFASHSPRYVFFHCDEAASGASSETLFCDTIRLLEKATPEDRERLLRVRIDHGDGFTSRLIVAHPISGESTVRYVEPARILGADDHEQAAVTADLHQRLHDPAVCYVHAWQSGDIVITDNHALLHGHRPRQDSAPRRLRRVNIL